MLRIESAASALQITLIRKNIDGVVFYCKKNIFFSAGKLCLFNIPCLGNDYYFQMFCEIFYGVRWSKKIKT